MTLHEAPAARFGSRDRELRERGVLAAREIRRMSLDGGYTTNNAVLNSSAQSNFSGAIQYLEIARSAAYEADRVAAAKTARQLAVSAASSIGTNLTYTIGQGTVMF